MMGMKKSCLFEESARRLSEGRNSARNRSVADVSTEIIGERASNSRRHLVLDGRVRGDVRSGASGVVCAAWRGGCAGGTRCPDCGFADHAFHPYRPGMGARGGAAPRSFSALGGTGTFSTIPVLESLAMRTDSRVRVTTFGAERTLTSDLVPLDVDAVLFWVVWDAKAACMEVADFTTSVELAAQTALRDAIGREAWRRLALRREQLDRELKKVLEEEVAPWGITIMSVQVRDILIPDELQNVMSLEAQAEQRKKARIILMEAEQDIAALLSETGESYAGNDCALNLRAMHLLYESIKDTGSSAVVPRVL